MFSKLEMGAFAQLFNRSGYVLDFSTADFNAFTMNSIGVPLCGHYGLSKGKSMLAYLDEADPIDATRLLLDLFEYYEFHFRRSLILLQRMNSIPISTRKARGACISNVRRLQIGNVPGRVTYSHRCAISKRNSRANL